MAKRSSFRYYYCQKMLELLQICPAVASVGEGNRQAKFDIDSTVYNLFVIVIFYSHQGEFWDWDILFTTQLNYICTDISELR